MRILVTGASGFLGSRLVAALLARGHDIVIPRRHPTEPSVTKSAKITQVTEIELNLETGFNSDHIPQVDVIYSLAQERDFREFPKRASETMNVNVASNTRLWEWASRTGVSRLIHASSGGVYASASPQPIREEYSTFVTHQATFYLATKLCAEVIFQSFAPLFQTTVLVRPFFLYGPSQNHQMFMQRMIERIKKADVVEIDERGGFYFNPIFVDDAALSFANALELQGHHIVNCAGPTITSLKKVSETIGQLLGKEPNFHVHSDNLVDFVADISKQSELLGAPVTELEDGLEQTILSDAR